LPTVYPWMQALIWAFKPTEKVDIRRFPREEAIEEEKELARLRGLPASLKAAIKESSAEAEADRPTKPADEAGAGAAGAKP